MTSRNLTEVFILMRNNAIQNRNMYEDNVSDSLLICQGRRHHTPFMSGNILIIRRSQMIAINYCRGHYTMPKKDYGCETILDHHQPG